MNKPSRRRFLFGTAASAGALAAGALPTARAVGTRAVFRLNPEWGAGSAGCPAGSDGAHRHDDCHACKACHGHARNKLYSSRESALRKGLRAHRFCKCKAYRGRELDAAVWKALFVRRDGTIRPYVDKRDARVQRILGLD